jgi:hypothetical protein
MFGGGAVAVVVWLTIALVASVVISLGLGIVALILRIKGKRKAAYWFCSPILFLIVAWCGVFWYLGPSPNTPRDVKFTVKPNEPFPHYRGWKSRLDWSKATRHSVKGDLTLDITLPDGKKISGTSRNLDVYETTNGLALITLYYHPDSPASRFFDHWSEGGTITKGGPYKGFILVQRAGYEAEVSPSQGAGFHTAIRFPPARLLPPPLNAAFHRHSGSITSPAPTR